MAFTLNTYHTADDPRTITKTLTNQIDYTCQLIDSAEMVAPTLRVRCTSETFNANYCYISFFDRYYFVTGQTVETANTILIHCKLDVLYTYRNALLSSTFLVTRNENIGSTYIPDTMLPLKGNKEMKVIEFTGGDFNLDTATANSYNFVLNVAGGGSNQGTTESGGLNT